MREEHRFENVDASEGLENALNSWPSINAILRFLVDVWALSADMRDRPAGPPPTQTRSYISGPVDELVAAVHTDRRKAGGRARNLFRDRDDNVACDMAMW